MSGYELSDLVYWEERIREKVAEFGLDPFPQEFEICDHHDMLAYMAYSGMPSHYPHWSYGKSFEMLKTKYDHGVSGLPYEMVINSDPSLAYLMRDNSLCLQILTMAHVYGHNDFFKNNFNFRQTRPEFTIGTFKAHAARVRAYAEDPSIGVERVESILDAAHAVSHQMRRNRALRVLSEDEERQRLDESAPPRTEAEGDPPQTPPAPRHFPASPEADLLLFIRDHNPYLEGWERDLLTIVHDEACYFLPQIETKIMNEGWASYWHREIMNSLELPPELQIEFLVRHNQVVQPHPGSINPYHVGLKLWDRIEALAIDRPEPRSDRESRNEHTPGGARALMFETRHADRDVSFLRRYLDEEAMRDLDLFEYEKQDDRYVVTAVSGDEKWRDVKETLLRMVGTGPLPVIQVIDSDFGGRHTLEMRHEHDGRDLQLDYAEHTLAHLHRLWGREVALETLLDGDPKRLVYGSEGFAAQAA